jgi:tetratricopeptide (TPR) repeat protein
MKEQARLAGILGGGFILAVMIWSTVLRPKQPVDTLHTQNLLEEGIGHFDGKEFVEAIAALEQVPAGSKQEAKALYYEGSSYLMLKDYAAATERLERSLALAPRDTGTLYALGVASFKLGNLKLARGYFASVLEINPNDEQAKGLMDIMANLERQTEAANQAGTAPAGQDGDHGESGDR